MYVKINNNFSLKEQLQTAMLKLLSL